MVLDRARPPGRVEPPAAGPPEWLEQLRADERADRTILHLIVGATTLLALLSLVTSLLAG